MVEFIYMDVVMVTIHKKEHIKLWRIGSLKANIHEELLTLGWGYQASKYLNNG